MKMKTIGYKTEHKITVEQTGKTYTRVSDNGKVYWSENSKDVNKHTSSELERAYQSQLQNLI